MTKPETLSFTARQLGLINIMATNLKRLAPETMEKLGESRFDQEMLDDLDEIIENTQFIMEEYDKEGEE